MTTDIRAAFEELVDAVKYGDTSELTAAMKAARLALAAEPVPPADGELAELLAWPRLTGEEQPCLSDAGYARLTRMRLAEIIREVDGNHDKGAAALAEAILSHPRISSAALPANGEVDTRYEFSVFDAECEEQAGGSAPSLTQALEEGRHYLAVYLQDGPHTLELRKVEVLSSNHFVDVPKMVEPVPPAGVALPPLLVAALELQKQKGLSRLFIPDPVHSVVLAPEPVPEGPADDDIEALHQAVFASRLQGPPPNTSFEVDLVRAALARWGHAPNA